MKKWRLFSLSFLLFSVVVASSWCLWATGDKTVIEYVIDSCTLRVRARSDWEASIPVYLEITKEDGKVLRSGSFFYYSPESLDMKTLGEGLEIHTVNTIIFIYEDEDPDEILAMIDIEDNLVYPPGPGGGNYEETKKYYSRVKELFSRLKKLLENDDLELRR